jgi:hypothetical protein
MVSKYRSKPTVVDGVRFASKREATRYGQLKLLQKANEIRDLELQPRFPLKVNGELVTTYVADFGYRESKNGNWVVEDTKGFRTDAYKIKAKLLKALNPGIDHREI